MSKGKGLLAAASVALLVVLHLGRCGKNNAPRTPEQTTAQGAPATAAAGTIDSLEGEVKVTRAGAARAGKAGLELNEGDAISTGATAWALLAMRDGATITVRPATEIRISIYRYAAEGPTSQNSSVLDLAKGALRVITGLIGQTNRSGYAVKTPIATIGIRGTDHEPAHYPPGATVDGHELGTYDKVNSGETAIRNPRGKVIVRPGRAAFAQYNGRAVPCRAALKCIVCLNRNAGNGNRSNPDSVST